MELNNIVSLVGSLGFPIVACGAMFWQNNKQDERHAEESAKWAQALEANTQAITKLEAAIDRMHDD